MTKQLHVHQTEEEEEEEGVKKRVGGWFDSRRLQSVRCPLGLCNAALLYFFPGLTEGLLLFCHFFVGVSTHGWTHDSLDRGEAGLKPTNVLHCPPVRIYLGRKLIPSSLRTEQ